MKNNHKNDQNDRSMLKKNLVDDSDLESTVTASTKASSVDTITSNPQEIFFEKWQRKYNTISEDEEFHHEAMETDTKNSNSDDVTTDENGETSYEAMETDQQNPSVGRQDEEVNLLDVYQLKQQRAYFSIMFSLAQTVILIIMMCQCGVAPLEINPMVGPYPDGLSHWGGKNAVLIIDDGQWWRLITPIFLHAGIFHLVGNVAVQMDMGAFFEKEWGSLIWLIVYIGSAVGGSVLSTISQPDMVSVGSSGAVCGLFGAKMAEVFCRMCESDKTLQGRVGHKVRKAQCGGVVCSVLLIGLMSFIPYVDWAAHLGGLIAGFFVGFMCFSLWIKTMKWRILWFLVGTALTVLGSVLFINYMYTEVDPIEELHDVCGYYKQHMENYECHCMREEYNVWGGGNGNSQD